METILAAKFRCYYCHQRIGLVDKTVQHCANSHQNQEVAILRPYLDGGRTRFKTVHFKLKADELTCNPSELSVDVDSWTLNIPIDTGAKTSLKFVSHLEDEHTALLEGCSITSSQMQRQIYDQIKADNDFPFLVDSRTIEYLKGSKVMFILRGLAGSGKSTIAHLLGSVYEGATLCSADDYFLQDDRLYHFDAEKLGEAHEECQKRAGKACKDGDSVIVIDNTNVRRWEMRFYCDVAKKHNYMVVIVLPKTSWRFDPDELAKRNKHGVDAELLTKKVSMFQEAAPLFWGWFLNMTDTDRTMDMASKYFRYCMDHVEEFAEAVKKSLGKDNDDNGEAAASISFDKLYSRDRASTEILHCTAFWAGREVPREVIDEYARSERVQDVMGKVTTLSIIGIVVTPRTIGARINLSEKQLALWGKDDFEQVSGEATNGMRRSQRGSRNKTKGQQNRSRKDKRNRSNRSIEVTVNTMVENTDDGQTLQGVAITPNQNKEPTCPESPPLLDFALFEENFEAQTLSTSEDISALKIKDQIEKKDLSWEISNNLGQELISEQALSSSLGDGTELEKEDTEEGAANPLDLENGAWSKEWDFSLPLKQKVENEGATCHGSQQWSMDVSPSSEMPPEVDSAFGSPASSIPESPLSRFHPTSGSGSRAHLTLGYTSGTRAVQTGFDLMDVVHQESSSLDDQSLVTVDGATIKYYGEGRCAVYFDEPYLVDVLFSGKY